MAVLPWPLRTNPNKGSGPLEPRVCPLFRIGAQTYPGSFEREWNGGLERPAYTTMLPGGTGRLPFTQPENRFVIRHAGASQVSHVAIAGRDIDHPFLQLPQACLQFGRDLIADISNCCVSPLSAQFVLLRYFPFSETDATFVRTGSGVPRPPQSSSSSWTFALLTICCWTLPGT
jgi:hypothetical protein